LIAAVTDVLTVVSTSASRSRSSGNDTTLRVKARIAKSNPTPFPTTMSAQPEGAVKARWAKEFLVEHIYHVERAGHVLGTYPRGAPS